MADAPLPEEMVCQVKQHGGCTHGARLGIAPYPVEWTGRTLSDVRYARPDCHAAWCHQCGRATEYRRVDTLAPTGT
jgi:hypothetical protein